MSMSDQSGRLHQAIIKQALTDAQARIKELEGRLQRIESNARNALLSLGVSEADAETPDPVFSLTVLAIGEHAKLAGRISWHRVLTAAQARIAELEGENEQLRKGAPLGPIVGAQ